jgi:hypothetical protein
MKGIAFAMSLSLLLVATTVGAAEKADSTSKPGADPATYKPKTKHDNTPYRFNMEQNGKRMSADEFDAWMKSRGVRVAKGKPTAAVDKPLAKDDPKPE